MELKIISIYNAPMTLLKGHVSGCVPTNPAFETRDRMVIIHSKATYTTE